MKRAWIDENKKIISFFQIESGQLLEAETPVFWKKVISLCKSGYRIQ